MSNLLTYAPGCELYYTFECKPSYMRSCGLLYTYGNDCEESFSDKGSHGYGDGSGYVDTYGSGQGVGWTRPSVWEGDLALKQQGFGDGYFAGSGQGFNLLNTRLR